MMKMIRLGKVAFALVLFAVSVSFAQTGRDYTDAEARRVGALFDAGNDLMERQKFAEALAKYKEALGVIPDSIGPLYNGGLAAFQLKDYEQALAMWKRVKELDADDWQTRTKIIQTYQSLGRLADRDRERAELYALRAKGSIEGLKNAEFYTREQTEMAGRRVMVFEHFELKGPRALRYAFYVLDAQGEAEFRISLGSYETTNAIWREVEKRKPEERLFHLDGYFKNGSHATYGMYVKEPTYDETREIVRKILEKEQKPISATIVDPPTEKKP